MRARIPALLCGLGVLAATLGLQSPAAAHTRITTDVTWSEHVREIVRKHCMVCHHPGGLAPDYVNLTVYGTDTQPGARAWAVAIEEMVLTNQMPPWKADDRFGHFSNARGLSTEEVDLLTGWIRGGAPQGPYRNLPVPEEFLEADWQFGEPDLVFELPEPHVLAADEQFGETTAEFTIEIEEDTYLTGYEFFPQNAKNIYRMTAYLHDPEGVEIPPIEMEVQLPFDPLADEDDLEEVREREMPAGPHFLGRWVRGDLPVLLPDAAGKMLRKGSKLVLRVEYERPMFADWSEEIRDLSKLGLFIAQADEEIDLLIESKPVQSDSFVIAANDANAEVTAEITMDENVHLVGVSPDLGLLAKDFEVVATYPDGRSRTLLYVPEYKRGWGVSFVFDEPVAAPIDTVIRLVAHYDNTADNWDNPNDPPADVSSGPGREEERLYAMLDYMLDDHLNIQVEFVPRDEPPRTSGGGGMAFFSGPDLTPVGRPEEPEDLLAAIKGVVPPTGEPAEDSLLDEIFWCPMRGGDFEGLVDYHGPGKCPECGMALKPKSWFFEGKDEAPLRYDWGLTKAGLQGTYWCPNRGNADHVMKDYYAPGQCEVDGEKLLHVAQFKEVKTYTCLSSDCDHYQAVFYDSGLCPSCGQPVTGLGHMDHNPLHGGWQFFMADNMFHHLEGAMHEPGQFKLYFYDDWKKPLDARNFSGRLFLEHVDPKTGEVTEEEIEMVVEKDGNTWLTSYLEPEFPVVFYALVYLGGVEKRYDFEFEELTIEPVGEVENSIRLHTHDRAPIAIPPTLDGILAGIDKQRGLLTSRIEREDWYGLHYPAFDAKDLVAGLVNHQSELNVRQRGQLKIAIGIVNRSANVIDRAGDSADPPRVRRGYASFGEAMDILSNLYPNSLEEN